MRAAGLLVPRGAVWSGLRMDGLLTPHREIPVILSDGRVIGHASAWRDTVGDMVVEAELDSAPPIPGFFLLPVAMQPHPGILTLQALRLSATHSENVPPLVTDEPTLTIEVGPSRRQRVAGALRVLAARLEAAAVELER